MADALPPDVGVVLRGAGAILGGCVVASGVLGVVFDDPVVALNSVGLLGACVLS